MDEIELAWAAGFFDGEGCFTTMRSKGRVYPAVSISQIDTEVLDRFDRAVGQVGHLYGPYRAKNSNNPQWRYKVQNVEAVLHVVELLTPYLSTIKIQDAGRMMQEYNSNKDIKFPNKSHRKGLI